MEENYTDTNISDAINCSVTKDFTQVPNELLRNPEMSWKSKGLLCLLLSNKEGWRTYIKTITKMGRDGETSVISGIQELERLGLLKTNSKNIEDIII
jgi:hypothetical protein